MVRTTHRPHPASTPARSRLRPLLALGLVAAGCGKGAPAEVAVPDGRRAGLLDCANEVHLVCAEGYRDGCERGATTWHVCVADREQPGAPCAAEVAQACPEGQMDACLGGLAASHLCVVATRE